MTTRRNSLLGAGAAALAGTALYAASTGAAYDEVADSVRAARLPAADRDLDYLVHYAVLAANSHNTQPWTFGGSGGRVTIRPDFSRATPAADPDNHHLFASLGCACENLMLAAAASGRSAEPGFIDDGDSRIEIDLAAGGNGRPPLFDAIPERQCTRSDYDGRPVDGADLQSLESAASLAGCDVVLIPDRDRIEQALELVIAANTAQVEDPAFAEELKSWLRFNAAHAVETRDGLYSACVGNPTLPGWLGRIMFQIAFKAGAVNDSYARQIRSSSGLAVFVSERDDRPHWVQAGRSYQRFALQATALGIRHAFINQPVEIAAIRPDFANWLGIGDRRPDLVIRYGYAPPMPRSLRRPVRDVIG